MTLTLSREQEDARIQLSRVSFKRFCNYVHGVKLARHHEMWVDMLTSGKIEDKLLCISAPPEFWKSRTIRMYIEWSIGRNPEWCSIYAMNTAEQAQKQVQAIENTIEFNEKYQKVFPYVIPDKENGWNKTMFFVHRQTVGRPDPTVLGCGVEGPIQGAHVEEIYTDDITDQQDVRSPTVMHSQREWVRGVLYDRLNKDNEEVPIGHWLAIFTRWGDGDLWPVFTELPIDDPDTDDRDENEAGMGFKSIQMPAINRDDPYPWGPVLWPEEYPEARLDAIRRVKGNQLYTLTYLCDPAGMGGLVFDRTKWNRFHIEEFVKWRYRVQSWDCASADSNDASYSVMVELSISNLGIYVTHVWRGRPMFNELKTMVIRLRDDRTPNVVLIEGKSTGTSLIREFKSDTTLPEMRAVDPVKTSNSLGGGSNKFDRAARHSNLLETGQLFLPMRAPWMPEFLSETAAFPKSRHDDQVDAFSQALDWVRANPMMMASGGANWMGRKMPEREPEYGAVG